jgi:hypothetical protein
LIKHRFIMRDVSDFKIFAAIPVEASLLTWKRWQRPPDWHALKERCTVIAEVMESARRAFDSCGVASRRLYDVVVAMRTEDKVLAELAERMDSHIEWATNARDRVAKSVESMRSAVAVMPPEEQDQTYDLFMRAVSLLVDDLTTDVDPERVVDQLYERYADHTLVLSHGPTPAKEKYRALVAKMAETFAALVTQLGTIRRVIEMRTDAAAALTDLVGSTPLPTTPCPPGIPFAAYTVEFDETVISVVEGCAWVSVRHGQSVEDALVEKAKEDVTTALEGLAIDRQRALLRQAEELLRARPEGRIKAIHAAYEPTDEEKRVVEIVSQMLTERSLNPKADTRIPVREIDPAKAHQARETERRDAAKQHATVRTIKFEVTPPRYLREAAEHILASPRKAHWVIGHWRNQPYGEKRVMHRQTWIKPHIRGLGEASATTARVVAPHVRPAT